MNDTPMPFAEMLASIRLNGFTQKQLAASLGISPQYLNDLEKGRKGASVAVVNRICAYMGRGPLGRAEWHRAGARTHGWEV